MVKQLDALNSKAKAVRDLFTPDAIELRHQLSYLCAKSIIADPLQCRRKAEELLWKKCFYDVVTFSKIHSKVKNTILFFLIISSQHFLAFFWFATLEIKTYSTGQILS